MLSMHHPLRLWYTDLPFWSESKRQSQAWIATNRSTNITELLPLQRTIEHKRVVPESDWCQGKGITLELNGLRQNLCDLQSAKWWQKGWVSTWESTSNHCTLNVSMEITGICFFSLMTFGVNLIVSYFFSHFSLSAF